MALAPRLNLEWVMFDSVSNPNLKAQKPGPYWASNKPATRAKAQVHTPQNILGQSKDEKRKSGKSDLVGLKLVQLPGLKSSIINLSFWLS